MAVLYRKYRPQTFAEVVNQKPIIQTLQNQVIAGQVGHAYLFTGSRGVGKTSIARILAKAVNCLKPGKNGDACGKCDVCKQVEAGNFLDLVEIDAASNTGVDNIRELIEHVKFAPSIGKYKVFIIDEVHMLSKGAFNALLKTLEEPPKHAIFILATTEINKVPATIISRTQKFDFKALSEEDLTEHLAAVVKQEKAKIPAEVLSLVAQNAQGSVRDSLSILDKILTLGDKVTLGQAESLLGVTDIALCKELLQLIAASQPKDIPAFFDRFSERGLDMLAFNRDFLEYLRTVLVGLVTGKAKDEIKLETADVLFVIRLFLRSYKEISDSPSPEIPLLIAAIEAASKKIPKASAAASPAPATPFHASAPAKTHSPSISISEMAAAPVITNEPVAETKPPSRPVAISFSEVQLSWPSVIDAVKKNNGPLASMLRAATLQRLDGDRLVVGVKFAFDKQSLQQAKNAKLLGEILNQVYNEQLNLWPEVIKSVAEEPTVAIGDALQVFGGELIE